VGPVYAKYLLETLPLWAKTLDSLTIVTDAETVETLASAAMSYIRVRLVTTDVFRRYGAFFNKGAALDVGYAAMRPRYTVLHFDADVVPPENWRDLASTHFRSGIVQGAFRVHEDGRPVKDSHWPYGFFQMWDSGDLRLRQWPLFDVHHAHAGNYDMNFLELWPVPSRVKMPFNVRHLGEPRRNWFGVGTDADEVEQEKQRRMDEIHRTGLRATWLKSQQGEGNLVIPPPRVQLSISEGDHAWVREIIEACMTPDPFAVAASVWKGEAPGCLRVGRDTSPELVRCYVSINTRDTAP
jgi:hypothetical protein